MAIVLASLSLLGLGIFGPGIARLVSGGPQLGAGAAAGTGCLPLAVLLLARLPVRGWQAARSPVPLLQRRARHLARGRRCDHGLCAGLGRQVGRGRSWLRHGGCRRAAVGAATSPLRKAGDGMKQSVPRRQPRGNHQHRRQYHAWAANTPPSPPPIRTAGQPAWAKR
jgi:type IV secretion system protein TrbL